ncbi:MAG: hypothetical protein DME31_10155 [Verrucomicrobia bacterium]|nr:MAG: hypothetical protein DME31_10155 [Verrucomicrobiota bacterium]
MFGLITETLWRFTETSLPIRLRREISRSVPRGMLEGDLSIAVGGSDLNRTALDMARLGKGDLFIFRLRSLNDLEA